MNDYDSPNRTNFHDGEGNLIAYKLTADFPEGFKNYSPPGDFTHTMSWNYPKGKELQAHIHKFTEKPVTNRTQEVIVIFSGKVKIMLYDENRRIIAELVAKPMEAVVFLAGGHGYEILEDNTRVLEVKNGPYVGADADREKF